MALLRIPIEERVMRRARSMMLVALLCCPAAVTAGAQSTATADARSASQVDEPFQLQPGDALRIQVWRQPELSGEFTVAADGSIAHPLYREIRVTGLSVAAARDQLDAILRRYVENPQFVVEPLLHVVVSGAVGRPDVYAVSPGTTIVQALAKAGGIAQDGEKDRVHLVRDLREQVVNLDDPRAGLMPVRSGDQILVDQRRQWFRSVIVPAATILGAVASVIIAIRRD